MKGKRERPPSPTDLAVTAIIERAEALGYVEDGVTRTTESLTATRAYGSGNIVRLGGRHRYTLPDTDEAFTIGRVTTYVYRKVKVRIEKSPHYDYPPGRAFDTLDFDNVIAELEARVAEARRCLS